MIKPINRTKQKRRYVLLCIGSYVAVLFVACHFSKAAVGGADLFQIVEGGLAHLRQQPFDILPINKEFLSHAAYIALIAPLLLYTEYLRRRDLRPAEESGSARWNEDIRSYNQVYAEMSLAWPNAFYRFPLKPIRSVLISLHNALTKVPILKHLYTPIHKAIVKRFGTVDKSPGSQNMIFSDQIYMSMNTRKTRRNNNILCIGGSGTGKSRFVVKPNLLQANCSYVITDPSGELVETMGKTLQDMGYEVRVFNLVQMEHSCCYNPFHYIRDQNGVLIMINSLIKNTTPKGASSNDPFWGARRSCLKRAGAA